MLASDCWWPTATNSFLNIGFPFATKREPDRVDGKENYDSWKYKVMDLWFLPDIFFWFISELRDLRVDPAAVALENLKVTRGSELKMMKLEDFKQITPEHGDKLYHRLQMKLRSSANEGSAGWVDTPLLQHPPSCLNLSHGQDYILTNLDYNCSPSHNQCSIVTHQKEDCVQAINLSRDSTKDFKNDRIIIKKQSNTFSSELDSGYNSDSTVEIKKEVIKEKPKRGRPKSIFKKQNPQTKVGRVWEFIRDLLLDPGNHSTVISWEDRHEGVFRFESGKQVANLWGQRRGNKRMTFENFSRSIRHNYKKGYLLPVEKKRLVYKFGPKSSGWRLDEVRP